MEKHYNEDDLIRGINENMISVRESLISRSVPSIRRMMVVSECFNEDLSVRSDVMAPDITDPILSALKYAIKLFWLKKYNKNPVWATGNVEEWDLCQALTAANFSQQFSKMTLSNMHTIHQICNGVRSDNDSITVGDAKDLLFLLAKCVKAIEDAIPMQIITASSEAPPLSDIEIIRNGEYRFTFLSNANDFPEIVAIHFVNELRSTINVVHVLPELQAACARKGRTLVTNTNESRDAIQRVKSRKTHDES